MGRGGKSFEVNARKRSDCHGWRFEGNSGKDSESYEENHKESLNLLGENLTNYEQNVMKQRF